jgi:6-phosphogluconolactonase (cycloisomerase 2 family)
MNLLRRASLVAGTLALSVAGSLAGITGVSAAPSVVGHVYVNDNTAGTNTIGAFNRMADGSLVAMPGSPFSAGGAGTGASLGSQGSLQVSTDGRYLLAVDAGSNQISVLRIARNGSLALVSSGPVASNGIEPVSIAVHENLVYVANEGDGATATGSNYTGFLLDPRGTLHPIPNSTIVLSPTASPGDVFFSPDGRHLVGTEVGPALIDSFDVVGGGLLALAPGSPFAAQGPGPFGSEFRPTNSSQVFVSNAHGGTDAGTVSAFDVTANGILTSVAGSPYADNQTAPCWVEISHDGQYLFTVNTGTPSISSYAIAADGTLTLIGSAPFANSAASPKPFDARLDPSGKFLYVVESGADAVGVFAVNGGTLTEISSSPFAGPAGATPFGMVVT